MYISKFIRAYMIYLNTNSRFDFITFFFLCVILATVGGIAVALLPPSIALPLIKTS